MDHLIKPQFEVGADKVGSGGIVRVEEYRQEAIEQVTKCAESLGRIRKGRYNLLLKGQKGISSF